MSASISESLPSKISCLHLQNCKDDEVWVFNIEHKNPVSYPAEIGRQRHGHTHIDTDTDMRKNAGARNVAFYKLNVGNADSCSMRRKDRCMHSRSIPVLILG